VFKLKHSIYPKVDDPMESDQCLSNSRPSSPDFLALYADLTPENIRLSQTEVRIIAAIRADRDAEIREYLLREQEWYSDMSRMHNHTARIAALESLLEYHHITFPA
jgi:hypothetical protein